MAVSAGELNRKIVLKVPTSTRSVRGEKKSAYTSLPAVHAKIEQKTEQRVIEVGLVSIDTEKITVRYSSITKDIRKDWKVEYDGTEHTIQANPKIINKQFIEFTVKASG